MARLEDITGKAISGEWGLDDEDATGIPVLRTTNFTNDGVINFSNVVTRTITKKDLSSKYLRPGDIIIEKSGGSDKQPVGRVVYYEEEPNRYLFNNFTGVLRIMNPNLWNSKYVFYALYANYLRGGTRKYQNKTTGLHNLKTEQYVREFELRECSIQEQRQIVFILDKLSEVISLRKEQLSKLDELVKARFVEMFGDPEYNPFKWPCISLGQLVTVEPQNGLYKPQSDYIQDGSGFPILRIDAFYDGKVTDFETLKRLNCSELEVQHYSLHENDIVINRVNSLEYLGKCAHIKGMTEPTVFESNMMRFHLNENAIDVGYATHLLCTQYIYRQIMRRAKKAVNQASINQKDVMGFQLLVPPIALQKHFSAVATKTEESKLTIQQSLDKLEVLKKSLMQEYFG